MATTIHHYPSLADVLENDGSSLFFRQKPKNWRWLTSATQRRFWCFHHAVSDGPLQAESIRSTDVRWLHPESVPGWSLFDTLESYASFLFNYIPMFINFHIHAMLLMLNMKKSSILKSIGSLFWARAKVTRCENSLFYCGTCPLSLYLKSSRQSFQFSCTSQKLVANDENFR